MRTLSLHCDYIKFKAEKKAVKDAPELNDKEKKEQEVKECLVVLTSVEKGDSQEELKQLLSSIEKHASEVKAKNIVLYPYAHLSSNLAPPKIALEMLEQAEHELKKKFNTTRAPFGYYKTFELKTKGHPLSELSKTFSSSKENEVKSVEKEITSEELKRLLKEMSTSKLDTSKLKDNDHRILGQRLELFNFNEVAPGSTFWYPSGLHIYNKLMQFARNAQEKENYQEIATPQIFSNALWKVSGHWTHYKDNMFLTKYEDRDFGVKPMNCPGAMLLFKSKTRSYKDLPLRLSDFGYLHRMELSGVLSGLFRVIRFMQDDAHIFCTNEQVGSEIASALKLIDFYYKKTFGFDYSLTLSTRPEKFMGEIEVWNQAEKTLEAELKKAKIKYTINKGDGAFYGPKIDLHIKDSLNRSWQCGTIQLDMQIPLRFELNYTGADNKEHTPLVIHRAIFGSLERFIGILLEHLNGNLPLWLSPRQVRIISFTDRNIKATEKIAQELKKAIPELKIDTDSRGDTVQAKIRDAELMKVNYILVVGDKEENSKTLAVRPRGKKPEFGIKIDKFIKQLEEELIV
ncbi:MAG: threonine--tRNA ligase [Nanoarchaeota archaeon]